MNLRTIADFTVLLAHRGRQLASPPLTTDLGERLVLANLIDSLTAQWKQNLRTTLSSDSVESETAKRLCEDLLVLEFCLRVTCSEMLSSESLELPGIEHGDHPLWLGPLKSVVEESLLAARQHLSESDHLLILKLQRRLSVWTDQLLATRGSTFWSEHFVHDAARYEQFLQDRNLPESGESAKLREALERAACQMIVPNRVCDSHSPKAEIMSLLKSLSKLVSWDQRSSEDLSTRTRRRIIDQSRCA
ncbi:hypothetical protein KOR42_20380 [Thalassoglobus neptunius]|uniref:Uncharacterized protein n=1 Tax=Thalassoglobus neptunius TaxID=1938619 RepID=A0A5C5X6J8_9PLAN|nr:hypothetical protein [Thalassoglobus neptunius]TWT58656.1 hypothetical protein KOR42_20380 [Thalassoglobus neptunius]